MKDKNKDKIVILCNLGGPRDLNEVEPFLLDLLSDPNIIRLPFFLKPFQKLLAQIIVKRRLPKSKQLYSEIGGKSPLVKITEIQARSLEKKTGYKVFICMRCGKPSTDELQHNLKEFILNESPSVNEAIIIPLYPQYSTTTTKSSFEQIESLFQKEFPQIKLRFVKSYAGHPKFVDAWKERIDLKLNQIAEPEKDSVLLLFSAHGIPKSYIDSGDPYLSELQESVSKIMKYFLANDHVLTFQSRFGPTKWLEPYTDDFVESLNKGQKVLVIPIAFVSDHVETIHEIGIELSAMAKEKGIQLNRTPGLNNNSTFIDCLADLVNQSNE
jgi:ferrochelatase